MTPPSLKDRIEITREVIDNRAIAREVRADEDGAVATFDGCVRNHSHGRTTLYLEYEAYESMALSKMQEIAAVLECTERNFLPPAWQKRIAEPDARSKLQERMMAIRQLIED